MLAQVGMENMDQHIPVIQNNPPALRVAAMMPVADASVTKPPRDLIGNCFQMRFRVAGADQEVIGN